MFFKKKSYFEKVQERTKQGIKNSTKEVLYDVQDCISRACNKGDNSTKADFDIQKIDKVKHVAQSLSEQGFKTEVEVGVYRVSLKIHW